MCFWALGGLFVLFFFNHKVVHFHGLFICCLSVTHWLIFRRKSLRHVHTRAQWNSTAAFNPSEAAHAFRLWWKPTCTTCKLYTITMLLIDWLIDCLIFNVFKKKKNTWPSVVLPWVHIMITRRWLKKKKVFEPTLVLIIQTNQQRIIKHQHVIV